MGRLSHAREAKLDWAAPALSRVPALPVTPVEVAALPHSARQVSAPRHWCFRPDSSWKGCPVRAGMLSSTLDPSQDLAIEAPRWWQSQCFQTGCLFLGSRTVPRSELLCALWRPQALLSLIPHLMLCLPPSWKGLLGGCLPCWSGCLLGPCS